MVNQKYWLGAADHLKEGDWRWMNDLSKVQYSGWHPNEPNNYGGNEDCALISMAHSWNDGTCKSSLGYICENQKVRFISYFIFSFMTSPNTTFPKTFDCQVIQDG